MARANNPQYSSSMKLGKVSNLLYMSLENKKIIHSMKTVCMVKSWPRRNQSKLLDFILPNASWIILKKYCRLRSGNTGNIFLHLVSQHCCIASWNPLLRVLPRTWPTCLAAHEVLQICGILGVWLVSWV